MAELLWVLLIFLALQHNVSASWWLLSRLAHGEQAVPVAAACNGVQRRQRALCERRPSLRAALTEGATLALVHCKHQMRAQRWNCSDQSIRYILANENRESAFLTSLGSAGAAHSLVRACARGALRCPCDHHHPSVVPRSATDGAAFRWGGCGHMLTGLRLAKQLSDLKGSPVRVHNARAGRRAVQSTGSVHCKCHGVSGSCGVRTCWAAAGRFGAAASALASRYSRARRLRLDNRGSLLPANPPHEDLVYLDGSPDFCSPNASLGIPGTGGRRCTPGTTGPGSCSALCCGRGAEGRRRLVKTKCGCRFDWCCTVKCRTCESWSSEKTCRH